MKIYEETDPSCGEPEITVRYARRDERVDRIVAFLQSMDMKIKCSGGDAERMINIPDIYYIESVDKKTYVYLEREVYHTGFRLYQLKEQLEGYGFVQISRSCILNISALESIRPLFNSRMEASLKNGEKVYINRKYLGDVKRALSGHSSWNGVP